MAAVSGNKKLTLFNSATSATVTVWNADASSLLAQSSNWSIIGESDPQQRVEDILPNKLQIRSIGSATYTLTISDHASLLRFTAACTITLPKTIQAGFTVICEQASAGVLTFVAASGATIHNRQSHTVTAGQYATATLIIHSNTSGEDAAYLLMGDTDSA